MKSEEWKQLADELEKHGTPDDIRELAEAVLVLGKELKKRRESGASELSEEFLTTLRSIEEFSNRKLKERRKRQRATRSGLVKAGELISLPTRSQEKLITAGVQIVQEPDAIERAYLARELVQCTLPHSDPGDVPLWTRTNRNYTLVIARTGFDRKTSRPIGYPYGSLPRLLLFWMNTEAVLTGKRRLEMGDTFSGFVRELGLNPERGGRRSDYHRLREQMRRLFSAAISFQGSSNEGNGIEGERKSNMLVADDSELWWNPRQPDQVTLLGSWVELGEKFFHALTAAPVPGDLRAIRALKRSPLALDLYIWATHKAFSANRKGNQFVPWAGLKEQFGGDYSTLKNFRAHAHAALKKIQTVYPGLKLQDATGGIIVLASSKPAVPYKSRLLEN